MYPAYSEPIIGEGLGFEYLLTLLHGGLRRGCSPYPVQIVLPTRCECKDNQTGYHGSRISFRCRGKNAVIEALDYLTNVQVMVHSVFPSILYS